MIAYYCFMKLEITFTSTWSNKGTLMSQWKTSKSILVTQLLNASCFVGAIICCWLVLATLLSVSWYFAAASTPCALSSDGNGDQKCVQTPCSVSINKEICPTKSVRECRMLDFVSPSVNKVCVCCCTLLYCAYFLSGSVQFQFSCNGVHYRNLILFMRSVAFSVIYSWNAVTAVILLN